jgi:hypothetical protein
MNFTYSTGLDVVKSTGHSEEGIKIAANPAASFQWSQFSLKHSKKEDRIRELVAKSTIAYTVDGLVKHSVDKFSELIKDFDFEGINDEAVKYVKKRLKDISVNINEHWKTFFTRVILEYFKTGNAFILKVRGGGRVLSTRPLYKNKPIAISGLFLVSAERLEPVFDSAGNGFRGWRLVDVKKEKVNTIRADARKLPTDQALYDIKVDNSDGVFIPGVDIVQIAYKKSADSNYGLAIVAPGLEDVAALRNLELNTLVLAKKFSNPLLHHKIIGTSPVGGAQDDINKAYSLHRFKPVDGVIITNHRHELKAIGAESQALRLEGYLKYFAARACAGLGTSPHLLGLEPATLGTAEAANEMLRDRVRFCQKDIARQFEMFIINELLWESGKYDPYSNDDDEVTLEFDDIDVDRTIKMQTHEADMFNKGVTDHEEMRKRSKIKGKHKDDLLYHNKVTIPVNRASVQDKAAAAAKKAKSKPKSAKEFEKAVLRFIPTSVEHIEDSLCLLERHFGYDKATLFSMFKDIENLIGDEEAIVALLYDNLEFKRM